MTNAQTELLGLLNQEFGVAKRRNPSYSLRAFAKKLDLQPSTLSDILNGKRRITRRMAAQILKRLGVDPVTAGRLQSALVRKRSDVIVPREFQQLTTDQFHVISNWFAFAIRSLSETAGFSDDPTWIARRMGISVRDAEQALERMERLGLMERRNGTLVTTDAPLTTSVDVHNASLQRCHAEHLDLAKDALDHVGVEARDISGISMAIDPAKIPEAKKRIQKFRRELCAFLESGDKTEVFRLNVQLFPLSKEIV